MQRQMELLSLSRKRRNTPLFRIGIGLHCGPAVVGNIGSDNRGGCRGGSEGMLPARLGYTRRLCLESVVATTNFLRRRQSRLSSRMILRVVVTVHGKPKSERRTERSVSTCRVTGQPYHLQCAVNGTGVNHRKIRRPFLEPL